MTLGLTEEQWIGAIAGVVLLGLFVLAERRPDPLVPLSIFRSRVFSGTNVVTLLLYGALAVVFFLLGLVLQGPLGYTPLQAGLATMPITLAMLLLSARAGALAERIGPRIPMTVGPLLVAASLLLMTRIEPSSSYVTDVLPGIVVFGLGLSLTVAPLTATALGAVADEHAGVASGVNNAVARTGQLLAVASIPIIAGFAPGAAIDAAELLDGFHRVLRFGAVAAVAAAVVAWVDRRRAQAGEDGGADVPLRGRRASCRGGRRTSPERVKPDRLPGTSISNVPSSLPMAMYNTMSRRITLGLATTALIFGVVACGDDDDGASDTTAPSAATEATPTTAATDTTE